MKSMFMAFVASLVMVAASSRAGGAEASGAIEGLIPAITQLAAGAWAAAGPETTLAVPEPGGWSMLFVGLLVAAAIARRRMPL